MQRTTFHVRFAPSDSHPTTAEERNRPERPFLRSEDREIIRSTRLDALARPHDSGYSRPVRLPQTGVTPCQVPTTISCSG
jgi:hypothetical protein